MPHPVLSTLLIVVAIVAIFIIDTLTDYEIAIAIFYSVLIIAVIRYLDKQFAMLFCGGCMALTLLSFYLTKQGTPDAGLLNCAISLAVIGITTYLSFKLLAAQTAAHEAQAQLLRMSRIAGAAELTGSIAHEINQPLTAITASANACVRWLDQTPPNIDKARNSAERTVADANRVASIVTHIKLLGQGKTPVKHLIHLDTLINQVIELSGPSMQAHGILLDIDLQTPQYQINANRVQIEQVIGNLILNAIDAMADTPAQIRQLSIATHPSDDNSTIQLSITDNGYGIDSTARTHLFDAFWTTKTDGMGLGLSISRTIIEAHDGTITASNNTPTGAILTITLPVAGVA
jgi:C4-dicarboxylate-specific signal transduction histidine kinase